MDIENHSDDRVMHDPREWAKDLGHNPPPYQRFTTQLQSLTEGQRLLPVRNLCQAIASGQISAIPADGKRVPVRMLTEQGKVQTRRVEDCWVKVDAAFDYWLAEQALATTYHLIRTTGKPGIAEADLHAGHLDVEQAQEALKAFLSRAKTAQQQKNKRAEPRKGRRIQPPGRPAGETRES